jgi:hypothetical protein
METLKCYEILDIAPGSNATQVREAYVKLAHVWHPDRYPGNPVLRKKALERMREIDEAYQSLRAFLPELQNAGEPFPEIVFVREENVLDAAERIGPRNPYEWTTIILVGLLLLGMISMAVYFVSQGQHQREVMEKIE